MYPQEEFDYGLLKKEKRIDHSNAKSLLLSALINNLTQTPNQLSIDSNNNLSNKLSQFKLNSRNNLNNASTSNNNSSNMSEDATSENSDDISNKKTC